MVNILYGVAGEGMGHATRSSVIITHLIRSGHKVSIVTSSRAFIYLKTIFPKLDIYQVQGLTLVYKDNSLKHLKSVYTNLKSKEIMSGILKVKKIIETHKIGLIITDFEPIVAYYSAFSSLSNHIPLISIDNIHLTSNCKIEVPPKDKKDFLVTKYITKLIIPPICVDKFLITTFFKLKTLNHKTELVPLIIRDDILNKKTTIKNHILVYQTSKSNTEMFNVLKNFKNEKFLVYGFDEDKKDSNLAFKKFSKLGFLKDFSSAKAIISNGGFSLISEAIFMHKPVLSVPVKKHFEQICNAINLDKKGFGKFSEELTITDLENFLKNLETYRRNLKKHKQKDNKKTFKMIDDVIKKCIF